VILNLETAAVHMVRSQSRSNNGGVLTIETTCGFESSRPASEPKPAEFSIWPSDTTCEACKQ
jgi:hypothetical protein